MTNDDDQTANGFAITEAVKEGGIFEDRAWYWGYYPAIAGDDPGKPGRQPYPHLMDGSTFGLLCGKPQAGYHVFIPIGAFAPPDKPYCEECRAVATERFNERRKQS